MDLLRDPEVGPTRSPAIRAQARDPRAEGLPIAAALRRRHRTAWRSGGEPAPLAGSPPPEAHPRSPKGPPAGTTPPTDVRHPLTVWSEAAPRQGGRPGEHVRLRAAHHSRHRSQGRGASAARIPPASAVCPRAFYGFGDVVAAVARTASEGSAKSCSLQTIGGKVTSSRSASAARALPNTLRTAGTPTKKAANASSNAMPIRSNLLLKTPTARGTPSRFLRRTPCQPGRRQCRGRSSWSLEARDGVRSLPGPPPRLPASAQQYVEEAGHDERCEISPRKIQHETATPS